MKASIVLLFGIGTQELFVLGGAGVVTATIVLVVYFLVKRKK